MEYPAAGSMEPLVVRGRRMEERRRSPRRPAEGEVAALPTAMNVQVMDISLGGVMLATVRPVDPGARGRLRLNLAGDQFVADLRITRVLPAPGAAPGYLLGAMFVGLDPVHQQLIERFINH
jgi:hypothetical protein